MCDPCWFVSLAGHDPLLCLAPQLHRAGAEPSAAVAYAGARKAADIERWLDKKVGSIPQYITSSATFSEFSSASTTLAVGFFTDADSSLAQAFKSAGTGLLRIAVGFTDDAELMSEVRY